MVKRATRTEQEPSPPQPETTPSGRTKRSEVTRALLLDTAERLFALQGYDATGVRQIAEEAGVNLGAIHYYWRTKEMLCRDALERRLVPMLNERAQGLDEVQSTDGGLGALFDASHRPSLLAGGASSENASSFRRFYGRMLFDPSPEVQAILASLLNGYAVRFVEMLRERCPDLSENEFYWRVTFMYGAFLYAHTQHTRTTALWGGRFDQSNFLDASRYLTRFLEAAMQAPPTDAPQTVPAKKRPGPVKQKASGRSRPKPA